MQHFELYAFSVILPSVYAVLALMAL